MCQDVFSVFQSFAHLSVRRLKCRSQWIREPFSLLVDISDHPSLAGQDYFSVVLEVHLDDFVAESEHYSVAGSHPLFDIRELGRSLVLRALYWVFLVPFRFLSFEIRSKMLQQSDLFLDFLGVLSQCIDLHYILSVALPPFNVIKAFGLRMQNYFGAVIEKYSSSSVA